MRTVNPLRNVPSLRSIMEPRFVYRPTGLHIVQPKDGKQLDLFEDYVPSILAFDLAKRFRDYSMFDVDKAQLLAYAYGAGPVTVCKLYNNS